MVRVTYQDYESTFLELMQKDNSVAIHQWNCKVLSSETLMVKNDLSPETMEEVFDLKVYL